MNVLIIDPDDVGLDFAMRCGEHGHAAKYFARPSGGERTKTGDGLVDKVPDWRKWVQWADLIVPTMNTVYLDELDGMRKYGYPIFGPSKESARLEIERGFGMQAFKKAGIEVPPYKMFKNLDEAEAHCWKNDQRYVFKTLGSEEDKSLTYVARDSADMINRIRLWKKQGLTVKGACMLQDVIDGIELGVSAWMGREGFLKGRGENVEHKKEMSGDYGPNCGESGTVMWYTQKSKLSKQVLDPLEAYLRSIGHVGDIDVNCIVDEKGKAWPLEFTCRLGWPAFYIMCAQHEEPCQWMLDALNGQDTLRYSEDPHVGVMLALPGWTTKGARQSAWQGIPIQGITHDNWPSLHLIAVMAGKGIEELEGKPTERDVFVTTGAYVLCAVGSGETVKQARKAAYKTIDGIHVPNAVIRDDIGEAFEKNMPKLQALGFATTLQ